jgi:hypothetical protein
MSDVCNCSANTVFLASGWCSSMAGALFADSRGLVQAWFHALADGGNLSCFFSLFFQMGLLNESVTYGDLWRHIMI